MNRVTVTIDDAAVRRAFAVAPQKMTERFDQDLARGAHEVAREARRLAPKAFSALTNAIAARRVEPLHYEVVAGVNYARAVEEGVKPGRQPGTKNGLMEWVRLKFGVTGRALERKTFLVARGIKARGLRAQRYMEPALDAQKDALIERVRAGARAAAAEFARG